MDKSIATSESPQVVIGNIKTDLTLKGWDQAEVLATSSSNDLSIETQDDVITVSCSGDCLVHVPSAAAVEVVSVDREARCMALEGNLSIGRVGGDLILREISTAQVDTVSRNLTAKQIRSELTIGNVGNDLILRDVGATNIGNVGRDLSVTKIRGDLVINNVGNDLALRDADSAQIKSVGRDMSARQIHGNLTIEYIGKDLVLRDVTTTQVGNIGRELSAKRVRGDLKIEQVGGNALARDVDGQFNANTTGGNLYLQGVSGGITVSVGGSATLDFSPVPWQAYSIQAGGDIRCKNPADINAEFNIVSGGQMIRVKTPTKSETIKDGTYTLTMGDGGAVVELSAGGAVKLITLSSEWEHPEEIEIDFGAKLGSMAEEIAEEATRQIEAQLEMLSEHLEAHLAGLSMSIGTAGLSEERVQHAKDRLEKARQRASRRAEDAAQRTRAKLEIKIAAIQRKAERKARATAARSARKERKRESMARVTAMTPPPYPPSPPQPPSNPVTDEERLLILQMLQDKKIGVEEAEQLLAALEGKGI